MVGAVNPIRFTLIVYAPLSFVAIPNQPHDLPTGEYQNAYQSLQGTTQYQLRIT
jgi:hypothetical protein